MTKTYKMSEEKRLQHRLYKQEERRKENRRHFKKACSEIAEQLEDVIDYYLLQAAQKGNDGESGRFNGRPAHSK